MNWLYLLAGVSKQGHIKAIKYLIAERSRQPCYVGLMQTVRQIHPSMGLRTMYEQFQPEGIGRDAFIALGLQEGYRLKVSENPIKTTISVKNSRFKNLLEDYRLTDVNQLWVSDIFYYPLESRHFYVVLIMDVYSRRIIGYSISDNMRAENNISALRMALEQRGTNNYRHRLIHHSDRGDQYVAEEYTQILDEYKIRISMCIDVLENAHCERVNGTIKNDYLRGWNPLTKGQLYERVPQAVKNYNNRKHKILKMTPIQYEIYVKELNVAQRTIMKIYTEKQFVEQESTQLSLFMNHHFTI